MGLLIGGGHYVSKSMSCGSLIESICLCKGEALNQDSASHTEALSRCVLLYQSANMFLPRCGF